MNAQREMPRSGLYVLDFVPGPMAELGAEVVRVEPDGGLPTGRHRAARRLARSPSMRGVGKRDGHAPRQMRT